MMKRLWTLLLLLALPSIGHAACVVTDAYSSLVCSYAPVRYFRMDASSGTTENDLGTSGVNGTYGGTFSLNATGIPAVTDKAVTFTGVAASRLSAGAAGGTVNGPDATNGVGWTANCWVNFSSTAGNQAVCGRVFAGQFQWFFLNINPGLYWQQYGVGGGGSCNGAGTNTAVSGLTPSTGTWYMLTFSSLGNGTNIDGVFYINGASQATVTNKSIATNAACSQNVFVGTDGGGLYPPSATIDEVSIIPSQLSAAQVLAMYNCGVGGTGCGATAGFFNVVQRERSRLRGWGWGIVAPSELADFVAYAR